MHNSVTDAVRTAQPKILVLGATGGTGGSAGHGGFLFDDLISPLLLRNVYADKNRQEAMVRENGLDWVLVRTSCGTTSLAAILCGR